MPKEAQRQQVLDILDTVQMKAFAARYPRELSGGQQQRVALARALVLKPKLLLLDEPFGALDKNLRLDMQIEIKRLQRQFGLTAIMVTHDQSEAMSISDRDRRHEPWPHRAARHAGGDLRPAGDAVRQFGFVGSCSLLEGRVESADATAVIASGWRTVRPCLRAAGRSCAVGDAVVLSARPEQLGAVRYGRRGPLPGRRGAEPAHGRQRHP